MNKTKFWRQNIFLKKKIKNSFGAVKINQLFSKQQIEILEQ